ncbi:MAG: glycerol-3-phosphate 1-O-acyltransferase PlsY [Calditrichaceae bacterium]|nr:glycerol-3-phosphate 1-O-acyltransferase PlsY [Calditrichaceae bacterium]MBN2708806.1 glycerol-3-phosphate 1-O-acyltransferase PlsY [Calditrichaceae bacterium]RQV97665.1 MAG: glycerol-3-phosphate 1-O-acyltransferase [Calditrichota bacterium]
MPELLLVILTGYLFGSIPTAIIAGKLLKGIDIREYGSGNAGATNVFRVLGWRAGVGVLLIDMLKGFIPVFWLTLLIYQGEWLVYYQIASAAAAIAGHIWTVFAGFRGGKGVGTSAGVFLALAPMPLGIALACFIIIVALTKYVSLGSILSALIFLLVMLAQRFIFEQYVPDVLIIMALLIVILIWYAHRENIKRLLKGNENKLSFKKKTGNTQ